jgi:Fur family peroxide stress response transcriptional regulator
MQRLDFKSVERMVLAQGLKMTPQRRAIIEYLQKCDTHPTADEILQAVNLQFPMTSRPTVYNTLNWLKGEGLIREVFESSPVRFDPNTSSHHHFVCQRCERVSDVSPHDIDPPSFASLPGQLRVDSYQITIRGLCAACQ